MKIFSLLLIIVGIICFCFVGHYLWLRYDPNRLSFKNYPYTATLSSNVKRLPIRVIIKSAGIDLPVFTAKIVNNQWQTTNDGASYLTASPLPGDKGNSVIYAHDFVSLFGNLVKVKQGDEVDIEYNDTSRKQFTVKLTKIVSPDDSKILESSNDKRITLYTCIGWFDTKRFVVVATVNSQ